MDYLKFIFYGLIQGLTEFIPVSSTAHLKILSLFFGINDPGSSLSAIMQIGSIFAILWYFRKNIFYLYDTNARNIYHFSLSNKIYKSIFIGSIPIILIGGMIKLFFTEFSDSFLRSNFSIGVLSILMALIMLFADISRSKSININNHKYMDSLFIGIAQAFAIFPGVSRSGATITIALLFGWERSDAAKFSFLLGIPAISLAAFVEFISSINEFLIFPFFPLIVGLITTFFSSLLAIDFLIKYISSKGLKVFVLYRFIFGILILFNL